MCKLSYSKLVGHEICQNKEAKATLVVLETDSV